MDKQYPALESLFYDGPRDKKCTYWIKNKRDTWILKQAGVPSGLKQFFYIKGLMFYASIFGRKLKALVQQGNIFTYSLHI